VLSNNLTTALWPKTGFLRRVEDVAALKQQQGKHIYLVGGAGTVASLIDAGMIDEIRIIVYPLIAGEGKSLFATMEQRHALRLKSTRRILGGRIRMHYTLG
jgi:dihydrofolate reductase